MPINQFVNETAYSEHTKSTTESEVSLIQSTNDVKFDGVNVEVDSPKFGDILYLENTGNANNLTKHFIDGESLNTSLLPNGYTPVGVVVDNNDKILIHYFKGYNEGDNTSKWVSAWLYELDVTIDGTERSIVFRQPKNSGYLAIGTFTYSSSTQEQFAQSLDTWLKSHQGGISAGGTWDYNWHCEYMENYAGVMKPIVIIDNAVDAKQYETDAIVDGATNVALANMAFMIPEVTDFEGYPRKNGGSGYRTGVNVAKMIAQFENNPTITTLSSMIEVDNSNDVVSRTQFTSDQYCANLRTAYGTYEKYIESLTLSYPSITGGNGIEYNKAKDWSNLLGSKQHKNISGTLINTFPIHAWCKSKTFNSDGLGAGNWYLACGIEYSKIMKKITYGLENVTTANCDTLNKVLSKINGNLVSCAQNRWTGARFSHADAWYLNGDGIMSAPSFSNLMRASCVCAL